VDTRPSDGMDSSSVTKHSRRSVLQALGAGPIALLGGLGRPPLGPHTTAAPRQLSARVQDDSRPNILLILLDDMRADDLAVMPAAKRCLSSRARPLRTASLRTPCAPRPEHRSCVGSTRITTEFGADGASTVSTPWDMKSLRSPPGCRCRLPHRPHRQVLECLPRRRISCGHHSVPSARLGRVGRHY
jgi:hypothetical protein